MATLTGPIWALIAFGTAAGLYAIGVGVRELLRGSRPLPELQEELT
jgi:hypothetical protein